MARSRRFLLLLLLSALLATTNASHHHSAAKSTSSSSHHHLPAKSTSSSSHHHHHHHLPAFNPSGHHHHHSPMATNTVSTFHPHHSPATTTTSDALSHHNHHSPASAGVDQSLIGLDPVAAASETPPSEGEAMEAAAAAAAQPSLLFPFQSASPPPALVVAPDLAFQPPPPPPQQPQVAAASAATTTETLPLSNQVPPGGSEAEQTLQQLARVLAELGYQEMASAAPLVADSPVLATWPGPVTVFAAPDASVVSSCPSCSRRHLLLEHMTPGLYPLASLTALPGATKLPSASMGFCLTLSSTPSPFPSHPAKLFVDGVEIARPELYNDGRFVIHGLQSFVPPLSLTSCFHGSSPPSQIATRSAASAATTGAVVRIMLRDAIVRLRDAGYGFLALAMRVKFAELERVGNMTVFALDDQAVFAGGGSSYVSDVRFHVVPGRLLTHDDLLRLSPGSVLQTLAGAGQNLVVTHSAGSGSGVRINYVPIKAPDAVLNSRIAVHGVFVPFPHLFLADLAASVAAASAISANSTCGMGAPFSDCATAAAAATAAQVPVGRVREAQ